MHPILSYYIISCMDSVLTCFASKLKLVLFLNWHCFLIVSSHRSGYFGLLLIVLLGYCAGIISTVCCQIRVKHTPIKCTLPLAYNTVLNYIQLGWLFWFVANVVLGYLFQDNYHSLLSNLYAMHHILIEKMKNKNKNKKQKIIKPCFYLHQNVQFMSKSQN